MVGNILFLSKWDKGINRRFGDPSRGYGLGFENHCTVRPKCMHTRLGTYHRILNYRFGSLDLLVQYESDAAMNREGPWPQVFEISDELCTVAHSCSLVQIVGNVVDTSSIVEIESREITNELPIDDILAQLFFSGTALMLLGRHTEGQFDSNDVKVLDMRDDIQNWVDRNQYRFRLLSRLVQCIQSLVIEEHRKTGCSKFALLGEQHNTGLFRRVGSTSIVLEEFVRAVFEGKWTKEEDLCIKLA